MAQVLIERQHKPACQSADRLKTLDNGVKHLVWIAFPPIPGREYFDLTSPLVPGCFNPAPDRLQISYAIPHHAPIKQHITRRLQPIAEVIPKNESRQRA